MFKGYSATQVRFEHAELFKRATRLVSLMPDVHDGEWVRCHEVARAVRRLLGAGTVVDGLYGCAVQHSWIDLDGCILDTYAVGRLPVVQYVDTSHHFKHALLLDVQPDVTRALGCRPVWGGLYQAAEPRTDIDEAVVSALVVSAGVREAVAAMKGKHVTVDREAVEFLRAEMMGKVLGVLALDSKVPLIPEETP